MLTIIVVVIFAVCAVIGFRKGLIKMAAGLVSSLAIIFLVSSVTPYISGWIRRFTPLEDSIRGKVTDMMTPGGDGSDSRDDATREEQISIIEGARLPEAFRRKLKENNNTEVYEALGVDSFGGYVGAYLAKIVADIIAFLITGAIVSVGVRILIGALGIFNRIPVIGGINRLLGLVAGLAVGLVTVWMIFALITVIYDTSLGRMCFEDIEQSAFLTWLYDGNLIMKSVTRF